LDRCACSASCGGLPFSISKFTYSKLNLLNC
jgi:hypothetical protein